MLDYRIRTFLTLYNEMSYRRTARLLNMTQPGVTQHIHFIENYYGVKLFSYNGRILTRTKYAEILKRHIDSILSEEREIFSEFSRKEKLVLNVGATKTIGEFVLVPTVRKICFGCWKMHSWILPWWRACSTNPDIPAIFSKRRNLWESVPERIRLRGRA